MILLHVREKQHVGNREVREDLKACERENHQTVLHLDEDQVRSCRDFGELRDHAKLVFKHIFRCTDWHQVPHYLEHTYRDQ